MPGAKKKKAMRQPQREGWLEVYEELTRVSFLESGNRQYVRKWVLLRDCWLYFYDSQEDVAFGKDADYHGQLRLEGLGHVVGHAREDLERRLTLLGHLGAHELEEHG